MKLRMFVIKKSSIRRSLLLAVTLIITGTALLHPFAAKADTRMNYVVGNVSSTHYLYPMLGANAGMFWLESAPALGYASLPEWDRKLAKGNMIVATPPGYAFASMGGLGRIGKYVQSKVRGATDNGRYDKDIFKYRRTVTAEGVTDEIEVEIGKHFKDNVNLEKLIGNVRRHLTTDASETQEIGSSAPADAIDDSNKEVDANVAPPLAHNLKLPVPVPESAKAQIVGGSLLMGGLILLGKAMLVLAL